MSSTQSKGACAEGVCNPNLTKNTQVQVKRGEDYVLVKLTGPGVFLAAEVMKQGGTTGLTFVTLDIDGRRVIDESYAGAKNAGLTQYNPFGIVLLKTQEHIENLTIGFPAPLRFEKKLVLLAKVDEDNVAQIVASVVHGST
jgi:hypothetical protein